MFFSVWTLLNWRSNISCVFRALSFTLSLPPLFSQFHPVSPMQLNRYTLKNIRAVLKYMGNVRVYLVTTITESNWSIFRIWHDFFDCTVSFCNGRKLFETERWHVQNLLGAWIQNFHYKSYIIDPLPPEESIINSHSYFTTSNRTQALRHSIHM